MKIVKNLFFLLFPILLFMIIFRLGVHGGHNNDFDLRKLYYYTVDSFSNETNDLIKDFNSMKTAMDNLQWDWKPTGEDEGLIINFLSNIWKWISNITSIIYLLYMFLTSTIKYCFMIAFDIVKVVGYAVGLVN